MNKLRPTLRFNSYSEDWVNGTINSISTKITDGTHDTPKPIKEGYPYLTAIHVKNGKIEYEKCYYLSEKDHKKIYKRCNPEKGDILMVNIGAGTANTALVEVDYEFSLKNVALIKPNREKIYPPFLAQIQIKNSLKLFNQISSGGAQPFLSLKEIGKLRLNFPSIPEQQKIASFLSAVDKKIEQLQQKKELLEQYKKGMMQKLFCQQLRFKDDNGNDFPEWEEKELGEIGTTFNGLTGKTKENFGSGKPYIQYKQIFDNARINTNQCGLVFIDKDESQSKVKYGDVFFTTSSETPNEIGTSSVLLDKVEEMYLNSFCFGYRPNLLKLYPKFSQYIFRSERFRKKIVKLAQGSTRYNMSKVELLKLILELPSIEEQTKIADFLTAIDNKIEIVAKELEGVKNFKKGLLQQMFV